MNWWTIFIHMGSLVCNNTKWCWLSEVFILNDVHTSSCMLHGCVLTQHPPFHLSWWYRWWHYITQMDSMSLWGVLPDLHNSSKSCWALVDCAPVVLCVVASGALYCTLNFQARFGQNSSSGFFDALICHSCRWVCVLWRIAPSVVLIMYALWGSF